MIGIYYQEQSRKGKKRLSATSHVFHLPRPRRANAVNIGMPPQVVLVMEVAYFVKSRPFVAQTRQVIFILAH